MARVPRGVDCRERPKAVSEMLRIASNLGSHWTWLHYTFFRIEALTEFTGALTPYLA